MTPSETPIQPDYTPMSVTGSVEDLKILHRAIHQSSLLMDLDNMDDAKKFRTLCKWSALVTQTIKDQQFESSLNPLPFPEK